jgi:molecular chaperone GrpE
MTEEKDEPEVNQIPTMENELKECKDKYLRLLAETENARKRLQKEKQESVRYAIDNILSEILDPVDNMENALKSTQNMSDEVKNWARGFQMILSQFKDVLAQNGVTEFHSKGETFDPHLHEAVETETTEEHPEGTILHEFVRGYKSGDRVLRPSRVKVAMPPSQNQSSNNSLEEEK